MEIKRVTIKMKCKWNETGEKEKWISEFKKVNVKV